MATIPGLAKAVCAVGLLALVSACAWASKDRRLLLNLMDENLIPASTAGKWLLSPVALPAGIVAGLADTIVVHPTTQIDDAWGDTVELLWETDGETGFRRVLLTPLTAAATPLVFAGDWLLRAVFDIPDRDDGDDELAEEPEEPMEEVGELEEVGR